MKISIRQISSVACQLASVIFLISGTLTKGPESMQKHQTALLFLILGIQFEQLKEEDEKE